MLNFIGFHFRLEAEYSAEMNLVILYLSEL